MFFPTSPGMYSVHARAASQSSSSSSSSSCFLIFSSSIRIFNQFNWMFFLFTALHINVYSNWLIQHKDINTCDALHICITHYTAYMSCNIALCAFFQCEFDFFYWVDNTYRRKRINLLKLCSFNLFLSLITLNR